MGAMECENCGIACSNIIIEIGNSYVRLCKKCYEEYKDDTIEDLCVSTKEDFSQSS